MMKHTAHIGYFTATHKVYSIECGILEFESNARTKSGLRRAAKKAAQKFIETVYRHATGYEVWNVQ